MAPDPRRQFLSRLKAPFRERAPQCRFEYVDATPFPGTSLKVTVPDRPGSVRVVAFSLWQNVKRFDPFPAKGAPHWQLQTYGGAGEMGEYLVSCDIARLAEAFSTWLELTAPAPLLRANPPATEHLRSATRRTSAPDRRSREAMPGAPWSSAPNPNRRSVCARLPPEGRRRSPSRRRRSRRPPRRRSCATPRWRC